MEKNFSPCPEDLKLSLSVFLPSLLSPFSLPLLFSLCLSLYPTGFTRMQLITSAGLTLKPSNIQHLKICPKEIISKAHAIMFKVIKCSIIYL